MLGCDFHPMPMDNKGMSPLAELVLFARMLALYARVRPAAYLGWTSKPNIYGTLAARLFGVPPINNVSGLGTAVIAESWITRVVTRLYRLALSGSAQVFSLSEDDRALFVARWIVPVERARVSPGLEIDIVRFSPRPRAL